MDNIKNQGFTIIEMVMVIVILGILASYVSIKSPSPISFDLNGATNQLLNNIRLTKSLSMSLNEQYRIALDSTNNRYQLQDSSGAPFPHPATNLDFTDLPTDVSLAGSSTIIFNALGQPLISGSLITSPVTITLNAGGTSQSIIIEPQTGFAHE